MHQRRRHAKSVQAPLLQQAPPLEALQQIFVCLLILSLVKLYFVKVFSQFYRYLILESEGGNEAFRAHYINGR